MPNKYLTKILNARVYDVAVETPLQIALRLSKRLDHRVFLKREDLQPVFSFKLRGAYNRIFQLSRTMRLESVISASAGNHAQGVAYAARKMGIKSLIFMPRTTPPIKIDAVKALGAKTELHGDSYDETYEYAHELANQENIPFIHPYDDPDVIAGQGTIAAEILRQYPDDLHAVFIPVGGGGLIAGMAVYIKMLKPQIKVIGVEPKDAACFKAAIDSGRRIKLHKVGLFADGVAVRQAGKEPFRIAKDLIDDIITVDTDEICAAIKDVFEDTRSIAEPAGALAVAGLKQYAQQYSGAGRTLVAIISGANMNFDRLRHVSERAELGEQREMLMAVEIPEKPGSFRMFCRALGKLSITEFNYRFSDIDKAYIFAGVELTQGIHQQQEMFSRLTTRGFKVLDVTDNEMAKLHIRYMVGGHPPPLVNERLLRLEFPERPGALLAFLEILHPDWNISLFHYRNHGAAYGRVLVGLQIPDQAWARFKRFLQKSGYQYQDETDNPAYDLFLR
ncbi:MAG: threonine ammonia-lyase, biosynthetic [Gammaproteobacteria bacterium]|nr:threonine ammonia-lyase, biosynthetic [Gammaproteobacteria bacterium]